MIDLIARTVKLEKEELILKFDVWFATQFGLCATLHEAINHCIANDLDPNKNISAIPVALTESTYEVLK